MATVVPASVPQRELRNDTAKLLRRVEAGERLTITVHGHPVAELGPVSADRTFVDTTEATAALSGLLDARDDLLRDLETDEGGLAEDPFD